MRVSHWFKSNHGAATRFPLCFGIGLEYAVVPSPQIGALGGAMVTERRQQYTS